ncbi:MAG: phage tail tape measure protein [Planctomycetota bacterium]|jgi:TP901 family phage tail tape measure protein
MAINLGDAILFLKGNNRDLNKKLGEAKKNTQQTMGHILQASKNVGAKMTAIGAGITATFGFAVKRTLEVRKSFADLGSLGVQDIDSIIKATRKLGREYAILSGEFATPLYDAKSAGIVEDALVGVAEVAAKASIGLKGNIGDAMKVGTDAMNAFGKMTGTAAEQVEAFNEIMGMAGIVIDKGKTNLEEMGKPLGRAIKAAEVLGMTMQEFFAIIAASTGPGINTAEAVTAISANLDNLAVPAEQAIVLAKRLGVGWNQAAAKTKGYTRVLLDMWNAIVENNDALKKRRAEIQDEIRLIESSSKKSKEQSDKLKELKEEMKGLSAVGETVENTFRNLFPSKEAFNQAVVLIENGGQKVFSIMNEMEQSGAQVDKMFQGFKENDPSFVFRQLGVSIDNLRMSIADNLIPKLTVLTDKILTVVDGVSAWVEAHPGLTTALSFLTSTVGALMFVLGPLFMMLPGIVTFFAIMKPVIIAVGAALTVLELEIMTVVLALGTLATAIAWAVIAWVPFFQMLFTGDWENNIITYLIDLINEDLIEAIGNAINWFNKLIGLGDSFDFSEHTPDYGPKMSNGGVSPGLAKGTKRAPRGFALVGEQGPELVNLRGGESVFPTSLTRSLLNAVSGPSQMQPAMVGGGGVNIYMGGVTVKNEAE